jgi:hypothetical protein
MEATVCDLETEKTSDNTPAKRILLIMDEDLKLL